MSSYASELRRIIRGFHGRTVAVLGDFMLDELVRGDATRISPEAPVPVVLARDEQREGFPGGAGNVAANITELGARAVPFGALGPDATAAKLRAKLRARGIPVTTLVAEAGRTTPRKVRIVAHQQQLLRLDFERPHPLTPRTARRLTQNFRRWLPRLDALIVSDYLKGSVTPELCAEFMEHARARRVPVFVDTKPEHAAICRGATLATPNLREAELMLGASGQLATPEARQRNAPLLLQKLGCTALLITLGAQGMTLVDSTAKEPVLEIPSVPRPVYDVTGAGDTVIAVLALASAAGATLQEAAQLANLAGGQAVLEFGTVPVSAPRLLAALRSDR
jgi:rfaE bifunctional protein kinase chain/domain